METGGTGECPLASVDDDVLAFALVEAHRPRHKPEPNPNLLPQKPGRNRDSVRNPRRHVCKGIRFARADNLA
jgi:hypothetical protein